MNLFCCISKEVFIFICFNEIQNIGWKKEGKSWLRMSLMKYKGVNNISYFDLYNHVIILQHSTTHLISVSFCFFYTLYSFISSCFSSLFIHLISLRISFTSFLFSILSTINTWQSSKNVHFSSSISVSSSSQHFIVFPVFYSIFTSLNLCLTKQHYSLFPFLKWFRDNLSFHLM